MYKLLTCSTTLPYLLLLICYAYGGVVLVGQNWSIMYNVTTMKMLERPHTKAKVKLDHVMATCLLHSELLSSLFSKVQRVRDATQPVVIQQF